MSAAEGHIGMQARLLRRGLLVCTNHAVLRGDAV